MDQKLTKFIILVHFIIYKRGQRCCRMLAYKGYKFGLNGTSKAYPLKKRWRCTGYNEFKCPVTVITYNDCLAFANHRHNHLPLEQCRILQTYARLRASMPRLLPMQNHS